MSAGTSTVLNAWGKCIWTAWCSHINDGTVWPGCSFCEEVTRGFQDFGSPDAGVAPPGLQLHTASDTKESAP